MIHGRMARIVLVAAALGCLGSTRASADDDLPTVSVRMGEGLELLLRMPGGGWKSKGTFDVIHVRTPQEPLLGILAALRSADAFPRDHRAPDGRPVARLTFEAPASTPWRYLAWVMQTADESAAKFDAIRLIDPRGGAPIEESLAPYAMRHSPDSELDNVGVFRIVLSRLDETDASQARTQIWLNGFEAVAGPGEVERARAFEALRTKVSELHLAHPDAPAGLSTPRPNGEAVPYADAIDTMRAIRAAGVPRILFAPLDPGQQPAPSIPVDASLRWLAAHQSGDGGWEAGGFAKWCDGKPSTEPAPDGSGRPEHDIAVTGLSLLAFLSAGYTSRGDHQYVQTVRSGLRYLKNFQDPSGRFGAEGGTHPILHAHGIATLAMVEAFGMTGSAIYKGPAQKALDYIESTRNPGLVWGAKPGESDTAITGWMVLSLLNAQIVDNNAVAAGSKVPLFLAPDAKDGLRAWLDRVTDPTTGRVGYTAKKTPDPRPTGSLEKFPPDRSEATTAIGVLVRLYLGEDPKTSEMMKKEIALLLAKPPRWSTEDGSIDMPYWFFASTALDVVWDPPYAQWRTSVGDLFEEHARHDTDACAYLRSWDPVDPWGEDGGRVYSTAIMTMTQLACTRSEVQRWR